MSAQAAPIPLPRTEDIYTALERECRLRGFTATYIATHSALKRLAEQHRAQLTAEGWVV